jgi:ABC-type glycerol-3-phosphate transport system substrate-binding protein
MKKTVKILLLTALLLISSIACASKEAEVFDLDFETNVNSDAVDLNGYSMRYAVTCSTLFGDSNAENILGFTSGTLFSDMAAKRKAEIEDKYNCTIDAFYQADGASENEFTVCSMSGVFYCDILQGSTHGLRSSMKIGFYQPVNTLQPYIDYRDSEKWGTPAMLEEMCWVGQLYGILPAAWPELNYSSFGYIFMANMNLASTLGIPDIRETVENKEWTWAKFEETLTAGTLIEGGETKVYGMSAHPPYLGEMMLRSNGDTIIIDKGNGEYSWGYAEPNAIKALTEFRNVYNGDYAFAFDHNVTSPDAVADAFIEGKATLTVVDTEQLFGYNGRISRNVENYAVLPAPTGPDVEPGRIFAVHESMRSMIVFSTYCKNLESAAFITDKIYEPFEGYETKDKIKDFMTYNYFFDERDADIFFEMFKNTEYNYFIVGMRQFNEIITDRKTKSIAELVELYKDYNENLLQTEAVSPRETIKTLWPEE